MKKLSAILMAAMLVLSLAACGKDDPKDNTNENVSETDVLVGGWTAPKSPEVTDAAKAALEKAAAGMDGAEYEPVALLATQVVAGTNYSLLCKITPVVPDPVATYALVTVYEALDGSAEIHEVFNSKAEAGVSGLAGGWTETESLDVTKEAGNALQAATANLTGVSYSPVALLATQVVAGTNYRLLCEVSPADQNPECRYTLVVVYEGVDGTTSILETYEFGAVED